MTSEQKKIKARLMKTVCHDTLICILSLNEIQKLRKKDGFLKFIADAQTERYKRIFRERPLQPMFS